MEPDQIQSTSDSLTQNQSKATLPLAPLSFSGTEEVLGSEPTSTPIANQTPFAVDVPDAVPSTSLNQGITREDVFQARDEMEQAEAAPQGALADIQQTEQRGFNAENFILNSVFGDSEPSQSEIKQQEILDNYLQRTIDIQGDLSKTEDEKSREIGLFTREKELAETNLRIAQKTRSLRERLRAFDTSAKERGVARNFVQSERRKIEADATAELADEYIIQAAQSGNLQRAQSFVDSAVEKRLQYFDIQNQQDQARLNALIPTLEGEKKKEAEQLLFAKEQASRNREDIRAKETEIRSLALDAAKNGAPSSVQQAMLSASTPEQALIAGGQYIGRLDRAYKQAQISNIYDTIKQRAIQARQSAIKAAGNEDETGEKRKADAEQALGIRQLAQQLLQEDGLSAAVGFGFRKSIIGSIPFVEGAAIEGSSRADFEANAKRLADMLTLDNLDLMSGVLSETDIKILERAGSNLATFSMSEEQYREEVNRIIDVANRTITNVGITPEQASFYNVVEDDDVSELQSIYSE